MPKLLFTQPEFTTLSCDLPEGVTNVGRSSRNNLVLSDASVSADHCELVVSWNEVIVRDHGSSNGTWVAGVRVNGQRPANHGDLLRFGRVEARLELDEFPTDDATSVTANFGVSRAFQSPPDAPSLPKMSGRPPAPETGHGTVSIPAPDQPVPPANIAPLQSTVPRSLAPTGHPKHRWQVVLLVVGVALMLAWLWRTFR